jgi:branched-subunit amino acid transport protein
MSGGGAVGATDLWTLAVIAALGGVTVIARGFFLLSDREWKLPAWADRGLQYAPVAALAAQGQWVGTLADARLFAALAGAAAYAWQRNVLVTIAVGMTVYLPLHLGLGW